jgi:hypothetical protein
MPFDSVTDQIDTTTPSATCHFRLRSAAHVNSNVEATGNGLLDRLANLAGDRSKYVCAPSAITVTRCLPGGTPIKFKG